ncbi:MAG: hypothetical protein RLZZ71_2216 [Bacteroidota bacterium]|jgi:hypothetical protein
MKLLNEIKLEIARREKELNSLVDAANLIASLQTGRGRKVKITAKIASILDKTGSPKSTSGKGRRGRPKGSKNKPGAKKTGPKKEITNSTPVASAPVAPKPMKKRGRKPGSSKTKAVKVAKTTKAEKA